METKEESKKIPRPTLLILFISIGISALIFIIGGIRSYNSPKKETPQKNNVSETIKSKKLPDYYNEYHLLKKGEIIRVIIPAGYDCNFYGGGKKYYNQPQNGKKEIWGGNSPTKTCEKKFNENGSYSDISYYNEEITVRCEFIKND